MKLRQRNILQYNNFVACPLWASVILQSLSLVIFRQRYMVLVKPELGSAYVTL